MHPAILLLALMLPQTRACEPPPEIERDLQAATRVIIRDARDFDRNIAPLRDVRARHPDDLFVHERYQDGVYRHGIEGHVNAMIQEYQDRAQRHPDDLVSQYLYARALIGRSTQTALATLTAIVTDHPDFAPAHRTLAATDATRAYSDEQGERIARERWRTLCPGAELTPWPVIVLAPPTPLIDAAERLLAGDSSAADRAVALALQGIQDDEWRLQRMRPFDWFSVEEKREAQHALVAKYWRLWALQVRAHRLSGRSEQANQLLAQMERRFSALEKSRDPACLDAQTILARLHAEDGPPQSR